MTFPPEARTPEEEDLWPVNPRTFGGRRGDWPWSVEQTADGGYIVAGATQSFGAGGQDWYVIKLDTQGELDPGWPVNPRTFGGTDWENAKSVQQTADGGYIVAGNNHYLDVGGGDVWLIKLDTQGELDPLWPVNPRTFGGTGNDAAWSVQQTADGGYIVAGYTESFGAGGQDVYLIKLAP